MASCGSMTCLAHMPEGAKVEGPSWARGLSCAMTSEPTTPASRKTFSTSRRVLTLARPLAGLAAGEPPVACPPPSGNGKCGLVGGGRGGEAEALQVGGGGGPGDECIPHNWAKENWNQF